MSCRFGGMDTRSPAVTHLMPSVKAIRANENGELILKIFFDTFLKIDLYPIFYFESNVAIPGELEELADLLNLVSEELHTVKYGNRILSMFGVR